MGLKSFNETGKSNKIKRNSNKTQRINRALTPERPFFAPSKTCSLGDRQPIAREEAAILQKVLFEIIKSIYVFTLLCCGKSFLDIGYRLVTKNSS